MCNNKKGTAHTFLVFFYSFAYSANSVYIKTGISFVKNCKFWFKHQKLKDF